MVKQVRLTDDNYKFLLTLKQARGCTIQRLVNELIERYYPKVSKNLLERTRQSIGG